MYATYPTHHVIFLVFADHECFMDESFGHSTSFFGLAML
jgi:hypothetical protein